jgi:hypothetical protein
MDVSLLVNLGFEIFRQVNLVWRRLKRFLGADLTMFLSGSFVARYWQHHHKVHPWSKGLFQT